MKRKIFLFFFTLATTCKTTQDIQKLFGKNVQSNEEIIIDGLWYYPLVYAVMWCRDAHVPLRIAERVTRPDPFIQALLLLRNCRQDERKTLRRNLEHMLFAKHSGTHAFPFTTKRS